MKSIQDHWWMIWGIFAASFLVAWRVCQRGGDESLFTRIRYALISNSDPENEGRRGVSGLSIVIIGIGLLLVLGMLVIVNLLNP